MRYMLVLLLLSTQVLAQPVEGPWEIWTASGIEYPLIRVNVSDTAEVYFTLDQSGAKSLSFISYGLGTHIAGPVVPIFDSDADTLALACVERAADRNSRIWWESRDGVVDVWMAWEDVQGSGSRIIYSGHYNSFWPGYDYVRPWQFALKRMNSHWMAAWTMHWENSNGWCLQVIEYPVVAVAINSDTVTIADDPYSGWQIGYSENGVHPQFIAFDADTLFLLARLYDLSIAPLQFGPDDWQWFAPRSLGCDLMPLSAQATHGEHWLVWTGADWYHPSDRVAAFTINGACSLLTTVDIQGDPADVAWHPDYGFAAIYVSPNSLQLVRVDTNGMQTLPAGTLMWRDSLHTFADASVAITSEGQIVTLWTETRVGDTAAARLMLVTVGWDTPLSSEPSVPILPPSSFSLSAYPNPFNSELRIQYDLPQGTDIELAIYNLLGEKVAVLAQGIKHSGVHSARWQPQVASGIYFAQLLAGTSAVMQKIVYLK